MDVRVRRALSWLERSQHSSGFLPKFSTGLRRVGVYPEITGYAITTFLGAFRRYGTESALGRARRAADAVIRTMQPNGAIPSEVGLDGSFEDRVYLFDQGIIARGLLDLASHLRESGDPDADRMVAFALRATDFVVDAVDREGPCNQYRLDGSPLDRLCYSIFVKCNLALHAAHRLTGDQRYLRLADRLVHFAIGGYQGEDGSFSVTAGSSLNRTHYHCYALEGLVEHHRETGDLRSWQALLAGSTALVRRQRIDGGFANRIHAREEDSLEDVPVAGQAANVLRYVSGLDPTADYREPIERALRSMADRQYRSLLPLLDGGFPFMVPRSGRLACSWACLFFVDADLADPRHPPLGEDRRNRLAHEPDAAARARSRTSRAPDEFP